MKTALILLSSLVLLVVGAVAVLALMFGGLNAVFNPDGGIIDRMLDESCEDQPKEDHFCPPR